MHDNNNGIKVGSEKQLKLGFLPFIYIMRVTTDNAVPGKNVIQ